MIITPSWCAQSYAYNDRVERTIAEYLAKITGLYVHDFTNGSPRPEYDFKIGDDLGDVTVELKTTGSKYIPVETHKDEKQTIEAGLYSSTAQIVVVLSQGQRTGYEGEVGKLRVWKRTSLLRDGVKFGSGKFFAGATPSQGSYTYSYSPKKDHGVHIWLGDIPVVYQQTTSFETKTLGYDFGAIFDDNPMGAADLKELINTLRGIE